MKTQVTLASRAVYHAIQWQGKDFDNFLDQINRLGGQEVTAATNAYDDEILVVLFRSLSFQLFPGDWLVVKEGDGPVEQYPWFDEIHRKYMEIDR